MPAADGSNRGVSPRAKAYYQRRSEEARGRGQKQCSRCRKVKPFSDFYLNKRGLPHGRCKKCSRVYAQQFRAEYRDQHKENSRRYRMANAERIRDAYRLKKYGLTREQYEAMLSEQQGRCAICPKILGPRLVIDHCHATGRVRGLLCRPCNTVLGLMEERPERFLAAVDYLR